MKNVYLLIIFSFLFSVYDVGDQISLEDQQIEAEICWGTHPIDFDSEIFTLADINGELNGGHYSILMFSIQAQDDYTTGIVHMIKQTVM